MMASWMNNLRGLTQAARKQGTNNNSQNQQPNRANTSSPTAFGPSAFGAANMPAAPPSPSLTTTMTANDQAHQNNQQSKKVPIFFREEYSGFVVKGNFQTLSTKPTLIEEGEWLAHQIVEQNRLLSGMLKCVQEKDRSSGRPTCNENSCPTMSAGQTTYTWIDTKHNPINLPAPIYIKHIQTWVAGKIQTPTLFPTDNFTSAPPVPNEPPKDGEWTGMASGFPKTFLTDVKNMYKQMFRCYAHLYWQHWLTFWDLNAHRDLNTCFVHFMNVGRNYNLLTENDTEPMAPLVAIWHKQGTLQDIPPDTEASDPNSTNPAAPTTSPSVATTSGVSSGPAGAEKSTHV